MADGSGKAPRTLREHTVDCHVGARIRERRRMLGMSMQRVAELLGVTCQQMHKYELGRNRIYAGRLYDIAQALHVPIAWFFEGLDDPLHEITPRERACVELAQNIAVIEDKKTLAALSQVARALTSRERNSS